MPFSFVKAGSQVLEADGVGGTRHEHVHTTVSPEPPVIDSFCGEFFFLSNYAPAITPRRCRRCGDGIDDTEDSAVGDVFDALIPEDVATYYDSFVQNGATVRDRAALEQLMKRPLSDVLDQVDSFEDDDVLELSAAGTLLIAEYVCGANPLPVLERVMTKEAEIREHRKRGREFDAFDGSGKQTSTPECEYEWYRKRHRPIHERLRAWCGHRSVTFVERLTAAESEVRRLDILVAELVDDLKKHDKFGAEIYDRRHDEERIRPETVRPVVDRPLAPWELPVREVPVRRGRWW